MKIFLTGGSRGIGYQIKECLTLHGIEVIAPSSEILDLTQPVRNAVQDVDGLIHCAGVNDIASYKDVNFNQFMELFKVNTFSFIELCQALNFSNGSNIIAIGSLYATSTNVGRIQYSMSKHALLAAVKTLALEMAYKNIKVNMVSPGFVDTAMTRENLDGDRIEFLEETIPFGLVSSNEIAKMCKYLITKNRSMTGQNIVIDGGYSLKGI